MLPVSFKMGRAKQSPKKTGCAKASREGAVGMLTAIGNPKDKYVYIECLSSRPLELLRIKAQTDKAGQSGSIGHKSEGAESHVQSMNRTTMQQL